MAIRVMAGELYSILQSGESVTVSPSANSLFPASGLSDGVAGQAFRFSAASTDAMVTVDGNRIKNANLDTWDGGTPQSWTADGTVTESTDSISGSAALLGFQSKISQVFRARSAERIVVNGWAASQTVGGGLAALLQNSETGNYATSTGGWQITPVGLFVITTTSGYSEAGPFAVTVEDFATVLKDTCDLRLVLVAVAGSTGSLADDWAVWSAVDTAVVAGHNIRADVAAQLRSSPDNFATTSSGSDFLQATMTKGQPSFYTTLTSAIDHRYWRLRLLYTSLSATLGISPTESVWLGEAAIGQATELTRPQDLGQEIRVLADNVRGSTPYGGATVHRFGEHPRRVLGMSFNFFTSSEYQQARQEVMERSFGSANPIVVIPDDTQPEVIHGRISDEWSVRNSLQGHYTENDLVVLEDSFPVWTP